MKWLVVFVILSFEDSRANPPEYSCSCEISPLTYSNFHQCENCKLAASGCRVFHHDIPTENECLQLLMNSTVYNGIEWRHVLEDLDWPQCRTIACKDVQTVPYTSDLRTVYWKTCDAGFKKKPLYIMPCLCYPKKTFNNMTQDEILAYLENATSIDTKNSSAALDKLRSRSDSRTSSAVIGTVGVVILSTLAGLIVCLDLITVCKKRYAKQESE